MTNKDKNKIASHLIQFIVDLHKTDNPESVANKGIDLVNNLLDEFLEVQDAVDKYIDNDADWDDMIYYIKMRKDYNKIK